MANQTVYEPVQVDVEQVQPISRTYQYRKVNVTSDQIK